ncbi:hypothetical protein F2Q70_00029062 [Brassica cretica]|uniref:Uncharacterized protein n=1 Tax=Brassica cretica TaxID=69181 RepID=A0A8S9FEG3_BRACR|nr:hypothetical protein F2Q70_00029062 [Brassica cretica]
MDLLERFEDLIAAIRMDGVPEDYLLCKLFKYTDTTQITLRSVTLIKRGSDVVLRDRIHKELGNN